MGTNNNLPYPPLECNPNITALDGFNEDFGKKEARIGLAVASALLLKGCCGGGPGGSVDILPAGTRTEFITTVGNTNTVLFAADAGRTYFQIQNLSCDLIYVRFGAVASATESYLLHPGGVITTRILQEVTLSINILSSGTSSEVYGFILTTT